MQGETPRFEGGKGGSGFLLSFFVEGGEDRRFEMLGVCTCIDSATVPSSGRYAIEGPDLGERGGKGRGGGLEDR